MLTLLANKFNKGGQKPGRGRILTDTPEKEEIKKHHVIKIVKRKRKPVKKPEFEIKATSSKQLSDIEDSHSTDDANSTVANINLDKIAEDYCEIEIFESLEIIQLDIEDINQRIETTEYEKLSNITRTPSSNSDFAVTPANPNNHVIRTGSVRYCSDYRDCTVLKVLKYEQNDLSDIILINIILQKIDKESRKQFELSLKTEVPTFDSIMKFLEKRSAVLENITRIPSTKIIHKNTAMSTKAKSLVVNSKKITVKLCILCRNSHPLYKCIAFQNMSVECRKKFVTNNKLCINCLRLHYGACMSKYKCTVSGCKGLHNSLLHDSDELCSAVKNHTRGERGIETNSNPTPFEGQPEVAVLTYGNKCVLLNTFMIFVKVLMDIELS
ncbi:DUF1758 domain-containing protein [Trichonephila clavipes]|nr:DUF1758 domain-containing protein [Trichonephila clavipes]